MRMSRSRSPSASRGSAGPAAPAKSLWSEYKHAEGRVYWSHSVTKQSVWEKPDELRTPFEKALLTTEWKQYVSKGRPYYVNSVTKETKWDLPEELVKLKKKVEREEEYKAERDRRRREGLDSPSPPTRTSSPERSPSPTPQSAVSIRSSDPSKAVGAHPDRNAAPTKAPLVWPMGGFLTHEKAEEAFIDLLKYEGIDDSFTWEDTMRKIIVHPFYKALETLAARKAAFEKYTRGLKAERLAVRQARIARVKPHIHRLFNQAELKSWMTMKTAEDLFRNDRYWREAEPDERREILEEWTGKLKAEQEAANRSLRERNIRVLTDLVKTLDLTVSTRWRGAHDQIVSAPAFREDKSLQKIETLDILNVWDEYSRQLEKEHDEESRRLRIETARKARKAREAYRGLLNELQVKGELTGFSKWKDTYPKIKDDERYLGMLGMPGSSAMDLWMDLVDDLAEETNAAADRVLRHLDGIKKEVKLDTTREEFEAWCKESGAVGHVDDKLRGSVYDMLHGRLVKAAEDEARRAERKRRHRIDDLRYALKSVSRHIDLDMTYEEAKPFMKDLPEYTDIADEEDRKTAFDKFVKRQKEKLREAAAEHSEYGSDRDRDRRDRERDRDHRDDRRYSSSGHALKDRYRDRDDAAASVDGTTPRRGDKRSEAMDVDGVPGGGDRSASKERRSSSRRRDERPDDERDDRAGRDRDRDRDRERSDRRSSRYEADDPERERRKDKWASHDRRRDTDERDSNTRDRGERRERDKHQSVEPDERDSKRAKVSSSKKGEDVEEGEI